MPCHSLSPTSGRSGPHQRPQCRSFSVAGKRGDRRRLEPLSVAECWPRVSGSLPPIYERLCKINNLFWFVPFFCFFPVRTIPQLRPAVCRRALCRPSVPCTARRPSAARGGAPRAGVTCSPSRWTPGFLGKEDTEWNQAFQVAWVQLFSAREACGPGSRCPCLDRASWERWRERGHRSLQPEGTPPRELRAAAERRNPVFL